MTNCAVHNGYGWAVNVQSSANVLLRGNSFYSFRPIGIGVTGAKNITIDNNVVGHIVDRTTIEAGDKFVDKAGAVSICSYHGADSSCSDLQVTNNIVGGSVYAGYVGPGHDCGDYNSNVFKNNVAHSIKGIVSGHGAFMRGDPARSGHSSCFELSYFTAYKCYYSGFFAYGPGKKIVVSRMTMIDNIAGFGSNL